MPDRFPAAPISSEEAGAAPSPVRSLESSGTGLAPAWHTAVVLFADARASPGGCPRQVTGYCRPRQPGAQLPLAMLVEWATVAFIWWGLSAGASGCPI